MLAKKVLHYATPPTRTFRKELKYLYERRTVVDSLIESLEHYDRFRARTSVGPSKRKSA